jgi:hypothetical protein
LTIFRLLRPSVLVPAVFVIVSVLLVAVLGVPYQRDVVAAWVMVGLLCLSLSDLRGYARGLVLEWLPFIAILIAYDSLRGTAGHLFGVHYLPQLQVDRALFGGTTPTVMLQRWLWHGQVLWYDVIAWAVYMTHFFVTPILAAILWKLDRPRFRRFAVLVVVLSFAGLITYAVYPAAPPWMASQGHLMAPITRIIPAVWHSLDLHSAGGLVETGYQYANNVAAVPSLHAAFSLLVAITLWPRRRRWLAPFVAAYPLLMAFAVVYTGEHYVADVLAGWAYTLAVVAGARAFARRRAARATAPRRLERALGGQAHPEPALVAVTHAAPDGG